MMTEEIIGAVAVCEKDKNYLMLKHRDGFWSFPGGKIENEDSSVVAGLIREIYEETGLTTKSFRLLETPIINKFIYGNEKPSRAGKRGKTVYFLMEILENSKIQPKSEVQKIGWFSKNEVLEKLFNNDMKEAFLKTIDYKIKNPSSSFLTIRL